MPPAPVRVPRVADLSHADAAARLKAAGFTVARAEEASAEPAGSVPRTSPAPGASVAKGSTVTVIVAKPDPTMTVVPNIYGVNTATSKAALLAAGLTPEPAFDRLITAHCEIRTYTPPAGVVVKRGTVVDVTAFMNCG